MRPLTALDAVALSVALSLLPACACETVPTGAVTECDAAAVLPDAVATDILFVIDDSGSMDNDQTRLSQNLSAFIDALVASPVRNDFRIGITSTSVEGFDPDAAGGQAYASGPSTGVPFPDGALVAIAQRADGTGLQGDLDYDAVANAATGGWGGRRILDRDSATLAQDFKANVLLGALGSSREQPFRAARLALSDRLADVNAGFLRPGARLAVFFLTDEDDCSGAAGTSVDANADCRAPATKLAVPPLLDQPGELAAFLLGPVDGELRDVVVGAIAGFDPVTLVPSCGSAALCANTACATAADKADRFSDLRLALGGARMRLASICDQRFGDTLTAFGEVLLPSTMPLRGVPADWRMLAVTRTTAAGAAVACVVAEEGSPEEAAADAVYGAPRLGRPAQLTFQNACRLALGDRIDVRLVCAG
jgi:hypothetical protein